MTIENLLTFNTAIKELGISRITLYRWIESKKIQTVDIDGKKFIDSRILTEIKNNAFRRKANGENL